MAATGSIHSLSTYTYLFIAFSPCTTALPFSSSTSKSASTQSLSRSLSLSSHLHSFSKRASDNNVGAAIGPLVGAVVLFFGLYIFYQWYRKRKDRDYFRRKEGDPRGRGTPATVSTAGTTVKRNPSDKSDSSGHSGSTLVSNGSGGGNFGTGKAVSSNGILEVMIMEDQEGIQPIKPVHADRRSSRNSGRESAAQTQGGIKAVPSSRETSLERLSLGGDRRESQGSIKLNQGAQRTVEVKKPEPVRHKAAGIRGSEYWTKNTSASQLASEAG